jgi:NitT/TauT family transport system substrate-binding protein
MRRTPRLLLPAIALFAFACQRDAAPPAAPTPPASPAAAALPHVRLQLNWFPEPEFGGIYAARERGLFSAEGVDVELLSGGADVPAPQLVASGKVEMAVLAAEQVLTLRAGGGQVKAVFASFQKAPRAIVVKADSPHATLESLWRSKATVLAQDGMSFVRWLNRSYGGKDLSFVPYAGSAAPLIAGSVDAMQAFATAEPVQLELDGVAVRTFAVADTGFDPYDVVVVVNEDYLAHQPAAVLAVVRALRAGWRSYLDDPAAINATMAAANRDMLPPVMAASAKLLPAFIESDDTRAHGLGWMDAGRWQTLAQQMVDLGDLTPPVDTAAAFVNLEDPATTATRSGKAGQ